MREDVQDDDLELVKALQDAIQPAGVPLLPMFDIEGRCLVSSSASEPGGSWFDVLVLPGGRLAISVGEVPGIGLTPSVTAAQMSAVIRAGLRRDGDVVMALELADVHAADLADSRGTAAVVVLLDPDSGTVTYATAGHPPPWVLSAADPRDLLGDTGGRPLGTGAPPDYAAATHSLSRGDGLLVVSAAAPSVPVLDAAGGADDIWSDGGIADLHVFVDRLAQRMTVDDTVCLVAVRWRPHPHSVLHVGLLGEGDAVRQARDELASWLTQLDASPMDQMALEHAAAELVTNAVEHSGPGGDHRVELKAELGADGRVIVEVTNHGPWRGMPDNPDRGRGLAMAAGLVDHLAVATNASRTRVLLQHRLVRPVAIEAIHPVNTEERLGGVELTQAAPHTLSMTGVVGHDDIERVAAQILIATRGGTVPLSLDLTAVTRLSTSAVRLLADLTSVTRGVGTETADIEIIAAANSVTQRALAVARVPHHVG